MPKYNTGKKTYDNNITWTKISEKKYNLIVDYNNTYDNVNKSTQAKLKLKKTFLDKIKKDYSKNGPLNLVNAIKETEDFFYFSELIDILEKYHSRTVDMSNEFNILNEFSNIVNLKKNVVIKFYKDFKADKMYLHPLLLANKEYLILPDIIDEMSNSNEFSYLYMKNYLNKNNKGVLPIKLINSLLKNTANSEDFNKFIDMCVNHCLDIYNNEKKDISLDLFTINQWNFIAQNLKNDELNNKIKINLKSLNNEIINNLFEEKSSFIKTIISKLSKTKLTNTDLFFNRDTVFFDNYIVDPFSLLKEDNNFTYKNNLISINTKFDDLEKLILSDEKFIDIKDNLNLLKFNIFNDLIKKTYSWSAYNSKIENSYLLEVINDLDNSLNNINEQINERLDALNNKNKNINQKLKMNC